MFFDEFQIQRHKIFFAKSQVTSKEGCLSRNDTQFFFTQNFFWWTWSKVPRPSMLLYRVGSLSFLHQFFFRVVRVILRKIEGKCGHTNILTDCVCLKKFLRATEVK